MNQSSRSATPRRTRCGWPMARQRRRGICRACPGAGQGGHCQGFIVAIDPTDRRNDGGLAPGLVETVVERCGRVPQRLLADTRAVPQEDIIKLADRHPAMTACSPPAPERAEVSTETLRSGAGNAIANHRRSTRDGANGQRGESRNLPPTQVDRTRPWHHQEPRHVALPGAWPRKGPRRLPVAGIGAQPWLGPYAAAPYCRGCRNDSTGNRMTATARKSSGVRHAPFIGLSPNPSPILPAASSSPKNGTSLS